MNEKATLREMFLLEELAKINDHMLEVQNLSPQLQKLYWTKFEKELKRMKKAEREALREIIDLLIKAVDPESIN